MTYLITFACYGCRLHGDKSGSVDREHNLYGSRLVEQDAKRAAAACERMDQTLAAILERCQLNHWTLLAAHVRTNHVHIVVDADVRPERIMNDLKSYASRCLNRLLLDDPARKRWAKHGSTRWLWKRERVSAAIRYVVDQQGDSMAVFEAMEVYG